MTAGQTFHWTLLDKTKQGVAVVLETRSDREAGMSPEVDQYAARWMDARSLKGEGSGSGDTLRFLLGMDDRVYLDGQQVVLTSLEERSS